MRRVKRHTGYQCQKSPSSKHVAAHIGHANWRQALTATCVYCGCDLLRIHPHSTAWRTLGELDSLNSLKADPSLEIPIA